MTSPAQVPTLDEETPEASSATANTSAAPPPASRPSSACAWPGVQPGQRGRVEGAGGNGEHRHVHQASQAQRHDHVQLLEPEQAVAVAFAAAEHVIFGQGRMQVDDVRHHGGAEDPDRQVQRPSAIQAGHQAMQRAVHGRAEPEGLVQEAGGDEAEQRDDRLLEAAPATGPQAQDGEGDQSGHQPGRQHRHAEQEVQPESRADELGDVGRHGHHLALHPHGPGGRAGKPVADQFRQRPAGDDTQLGGQVLHHHRHQVRGKDDPQQQVAVLRPALDVGGEVPGIDVGHRRHERRAEHGQPAADPSPGQEPSKRARARGQRELLARHRNAGIRGRELGLRGGHGPEPRAPLDEQASHVLVIRARKAGRKTHGQRRSVAEQESHSLVIRAHQVGPETYRQAAKAMS